MSLNPEVLEFDSLLPAEDSLLFKEPDPGPISQDAFSSLDLPDFSNFAVEDVDFGDLEFLDLASVPHDKTKKSSSTATGPYFNSLATPSGYCSTNYLTEEANRLSVLLSDSGQHKDRSSTGDDRTLLDNLEEFFGVSQGGPVEDETKEYINTAGDIASESTYDVNPSSLELPILEPAPALHDNDFRQITIKSIVSVEDAAPPPGAVAKIVIKTSNKYNYTKFTFASIDDQEKHAFTVKTSNLMKAITSLKPLNLDSIEVIRRLLLLGPDVSPRPVKRTFDQVNGVPEIVNNKKPKLESCLPVSVLPNDRLRRPDDEDSLKASLLEHGIKVDSILRVKIASGQKFWCCPEPGCGKAYGKGHEVKLHILAHYNVKPFPCPEPGCDWAFLTRTKLLRHQQSHARSKPFICNVQGCNKSFTTVYNLNTHLKLHNRDFAWQCEKCDARFQTERESQVHNSQRHKQEMMPDLRCPVPGCSKAYFTKSTLDAHIKTHGAVRNTTCDICGKTFDKPSRLKTHMVFHTGERPFACDFEGCSWTFPTQSKLSRHKRTHSDVKNFQCPTCDKVFNRSDHLQQHLQSHNSLKVNKREMKSGKSIKYFICPVPKCTKKYVTRSAFTAHLKTVHQEAEVPPDSLAGPSDDISAGQLDFVALLSCVDDLQLPVPVQVRILASHWSRLIT